MPQPDYRIHEMNKRLQQRTDDSDNLWWDAFATEFFEDDANLTLTFCLEDGPKRYSKKKISYNIKTLPKVLCKPHYSNSHLKMVVCKWKAPH